MTIKVGILQTGNPPPPLPERFGSYSTMVQELLGRPGHEFATFDVRNGELGLGVTVARILVGQALADLMVFAEVLQRRLRIAQRQLRVAQPLVGGGQVGLGPGASRLILVGNWSD